MVISYLTILQHDVMDFRKDVSERLKKYTRNLPPPGLTWKTKRDERGSQDNRKDFASEQRKQAALQWDMLLSQSSIQKASSSKNCQKASCEVDHSLPRGMFAILIFLCQRAHSS